MKLAVFCPHFEDTGGVREVVSRLAAAHEAMGHRVHVVTRRHAEDQTAGALLQSDGSALWRVRMAPAPTGLFDSRARGRFLRRFATGALPLALRLRRLAPDVVAAHCSKFYAPWIAVAAAVAQRPVVVHLHNAERTADGPEHRLWARLLLRAATRVVAVSPSVAAYAAALRPALAGRVDVIRNGIDRGDFADVRPETRPAPFALIVARLSAQKGVDVALEALARTRRHTPLVVAGDGPDRALLEAQATRLGIASRVELLGDVPRSRVKALLAGAAFVVMPSRFEGNPLVSLEAMGAGAALVASDIPGLPPELVDEATALLVPPEDPERLAQAMDRLAADDSFRQRLGVAARVASHDVPSWQEVALAVLETYSKASHST